MRRLRRTATATRPASPKSVTTLDVLAFVVLQLMPPPSSDAASSGLGGSALPLVPLVPPLEAPELPELPASLAEPSMPPSAITVGPHTPPLQRGYTRDDEGVASEIEAVAGDAVRHRLLGEAEARVELCDEIEDHALRRRPQPCPRRCGT